jgi:hypothetical protein
VIDRTTADGKLLDGHNIGNITNDKTDANFVKAETEYKGAVNGFTDANMPFMTKAMMLRYNKVLEEDAKRDTPALAAKIPYTISALFHGKKTSQGTCPATVPAFANGVNGAKVVGKGPHGAHDENMSGSIVPVDCADGFTASPEGSNPLVFQRCEPVPEFKRVYAWVAHGTCDATSAPTKTPTIAPTSAPTSAPTKDAYTYSNKIGCSSNPSLSTLISTSDAITLDEAKALCDENPACVSFWMKTYLTPSHHPLPGRSQVNFYSTCAAYRAAYSSLYVKKVGTKEVPTCTVSTQSCEHYKYSVVSNAYTNSETTGCSSNPSLSTLISTSDAITLNEAKALCDENPACVSFWMKTYLAPSYHPLPGRSQVKFYSTCAAYRAAYSSLYVKKFGSKEVSTCTASTHPSVSSSCKLYKHSVVAFDKNGCSVAWC